MTKDISMIRLNGLATAIAALTFSAAAMADEHSSVQRSCSETTRLTYGFQCQGQAQVIPGLGLEPVTLVGTVSGSESGVFDGRGIFNSSLGPIGQHLVGQAVFQDRTCFGHIKYRVFVSLPNGADGPELPPLDIDFATVDGGSEILGVPTGPGATGAAVPRLSCRLVKVRG
jgi:hypothetical protein